MTNFSTKYIKRTGFMGVQRYTAEIRFRLPGSNVLIKVDSPEVIHWSMNGTGMLSTGDLIDILTYIRSVNDEIKSRNDLL
jgi:hypothetical protein